MVCFGIQQSAPDQFDIALRRLVALLRFLLEGVQNIDGLLKSHRVDGAIGVLVEIIYKFNDAAASALQWLRRGRMLAGLDQEQFETKAVLHARRKGPKILAAGAYPSQRSSRARQLFHSGIMSMHS